MYVYLHIYIYTYLHVEYIYIYIWRGPFGFISFLHSHVHTRAFWDHRWRKPLSTMVLGKVPSAMVFFWPFSTCVCLLLLEWTGFPTRSMKQDLFNLFFGCFSLSSLVVTWVNGFVIVCGCWGGRGVVLCTCLLLPGWTG